MISHKSTRIWSFSINSNSWMQSSSHQLSFQWPAMGFRINILQRLRSHFFKKTNYYIWVSLLSTHYSKYYCSYAHCIHNLIPIFKLQWLRERNHGNGNFDFRTQDGSLQKGIGRHPKSLPTIMDHSDCKSPSFIIPFICIHHWNHYQKPASKYEVNIYTH